jgi:integrase
MMTEREAATVLEPLMTDPALVEEWQEFLRAMDDQYAQLAALRAEPYTRFTTDEYRAVAALAAATGLRPRDLCAAGGTIWSACLWLRDATAVVADAGPNDAGRAM